jgi:hypothetical protein
MRMINTIEMRGKIDMVWPKDRGKRFSSDKIEN